MGVANLKVSGTDRNDFRDDVTTFTLHGELGLNLPLMERLITASNGSTQAAKLRALPMISTPMPFVSPFGFSFDLLVTP